MNIDPNGKGWIDWAATKVSNKPSGPSPDGAELSQVSLWLFLPPAALWFDQHFTRHRTLPSLQPGKPVDQTACGVSSGVCVGGELQAGVQLARAGQAGLGHSAPLRWPGTSSAFQTTPAGSGTRLLPHTYPLTALLPVCAHRRSW